MGPLKDLAARDAASPRPSAVPTISLDDNNPECWGDPLTDPDDFTDPDDLIDPDDFERAVQVIAASGLGFPQLSGAAVKAYIAIVKGVVPPPTGKLLEWGPIDTARSVMMLAREIPKLLESEKARAAAAARAEEDRLYQEQQDAERAACEVDPARCDLHRIPVTLDGYGKEEARTARVLELLRQSPHEMLGHRGERYSATCPRCEGRLVLESWGSNLMGRCLGGCASGVIGADLTGRLPELRRLEAVRQDEEERLALESEREEMFASCSLDVLDSVGELEFVMDEIVPDKMLTMLVGKVGSRKTLVGMSHALALALGAPWVNRATRQGPVMLVLLEGSPEDRKRRIDRLAGGFDTTRDALKRRLLLYPHALKTEDSESFTQFLDVVRVTNPRSILIDSLSELCDGISQAGMSDRARMLPVLQPLRDLAQDKLRASRGVAGRAITLIHHANASGGVAGGDGIEQHADHVLYLDADSDRNDSMIEVSRGKSRAGHDFAPFRIRFVDRPDGALVAELVPSRRDRDEDEPHDPDAKLASLICAALPLAATALSAAMKAKGFGSDTVHRVREKLTREGAIVKHGKMWAVATSAGGKLPPALDAPTVIR